MSGPLDSAEIGIPCDACGHETKKTVGWVKTHCDFTCVCGTNIHLNADQFRSEIAKAEAEIKKLGDSISKMGKTS
jgi:hypothetical protein